MIAFREAFRLTLEHVGPLGKETVSLVEATGRTAAESLTARVWSPSADSSLKDGYAVQSADVQEASTDHPVRLKLVGRAPAGGTWEGELQPGQAVRILSGAPIPAGAQAVLAEEYTRVEGQAVTALNTAEPGRNVLPRGEDVRKGEELVKTGERLRPTVVGYLASAGYSRIPVVKTPRVGVIATGDEVVAPGRPLREGQLYASNLVTLASWCRQYGFAVETDVLPDQREGLKEGLARALDRYDAVLTSGGAWKGDRDLVVGVLEELGWVKIYHRVRMGPGKAVGFGRVGGKPVFCLPGGPPSNHMAFLQLALPGLLRLAGWRRPGLPEFPVILTEEICGQCDWTQFVHGRLMQGETGLLFAPLDLKSRLQMLAGGEAVVRIPEGKARIRAGRIVPGQILR
jgi:molybdopterin molybdotransferase